MEKKEILSAKRKRAVFKKAMSQAIDTGNLKSPLLPEMTDTEYYKMNMNEESKMAYSTLSNRESISEEVSPSLVNREEYSSHVMDKLYEKLK